MSLELKSKKSGKAASNSDTLVISHLPRVNLLPREIVEKRDLKALQKKLAFYLVLVLALALLSVVAFKFLEIQAETRMKDADAKTRELQVEAQKYAEVPLVLQQIETAKTALRDGMYRELLWDQYLGAIAATVPDGGIIQSLSATMATPNSPGPASSDELQTDSVGQISFTANFETIPDVPAWIEKLESVPGFQEARLEAVSYTGEDDKESYSFLGTVRVTEDAYSLRFEPKEDEVKE